MILTRTLHDSYYNHTWLLKQPYMILTRTILDSLHDSYKNLTRFLLESYLIPKGTLHDSCKNLTWTLQDSYKNFVWFLQEPYLILTKTLHDSYTKLCTILHCPCMNLTWYSLYTIWCTYPQKDFVHDQNGLLPEVWTTWGCQCKDIICQVPTNGSTLLLYHRNSQLADFWAQGLNMLLVCVQQEMMT